jgi:hypothetical protein
MTVTPESRKDNFSVGGMAVAYQYLYSRYKSITVPIPKRFRNGRFASQTALRRYQEAKWEAATWQGGIIGRFHPQVSCGNV